MAKPKKCLMLKTKDNRTFFTEEKHHSYLKEFASVYQVKLKLVEAFSPPLLSLKGLVEKICDQNYHTGFVKYHLR